MGWLWTRAFQSYQGRGCQKNLPCSHFAGYFIHQDPGYMLHVVFGRCHHSKNGMTPVKRYYESSDITGTFVRSVIRRKTSKQCFSNPHLAVVLSRMSGTLAVTWELHYCYLALEQWCVWQEEYMPILVPSWAPFLVLLALNFPAMVGLRCIVQIRAIYAIVIPAVYFT